MGIGEDGPTARLHVRSTGITAGAPSKVGSDWNADNDNNAKIVALLETGEMVIMLLQDMEQV